MKRFSICIVDDDNQICRILVDLFTREGYLTSAASNGKEAIEIIENTSPDLVISDIQMPVMDGFELFQYIERERPQIKHILMTSYDIDQYIRYIRKYNIGNILVKGSDFNLAEVSAYVKLILTGEIFGLDRYLPGIAFRQFNIRSYAEARAAYDQIIENYPDKKKFFLKIAIDELISNAIFHGVLELSSISRDHWTENIIIPEENAVKLTWGSDQQKIGISIEDPNGRLKKTDVLKWLDANRCSDRMNEHGRGLLLVRRLIDRLIINIDPGKRTECIIIQNINRFHEDYNKPLLIHEL